MALGIRTLLLLSLLLLGSCSVGLELFGGYTQMGLSGTAALDSSAGGVPLGTTQIDVDDDLGLGDEVGSPYARAELDLGLIVLTGSGFIFQEEGTGTITADFGDFTAGTTVDSDIQIGNLKTALTFDIIDLGVLRLSPGVAVDTFDIDMTVTATAPVMGSERLEILTPVPMLFLQSEVDVGPVGATVDAGWISVDNLGDVSGTWWDIEGLATVDILAGLELFGGYRFISIESNGDADGQDFDVDLELQGWIIGGGFSW